MLGHAEECVAVWLKFFKITSIWLACFEKQFEK